MADDYVPYVPIPYTPLPYVSSREYSNRPYTQSLMELVGRAGQREAEATRRRSELLASRTGALGQIASSTLGSLFAGRDEAAKMAREDEARKAEQARYNETQRYRQLAEGREATQEVDRQAGLRRQANLRGVAAMPGMSDEDRAIEFAAIDPEYAQSWLANQQRAQMQRTTFEQGQDDRRRQDNLRGVVQMGLPVEQRNRELLGIDPMRGAQIIDALTTNPPTLQQRYDAASASGNQPEMARLIREMRTLDRPTSNEIPLSQKQLPREMQSYLASLKSGGMRNGALYSPRTYEEARSEVLRTWPTLSSAHTNLDLNTVLATLDKLWPAYTDPLTGVTMRDPVVRQ